MPASLINGRDNITGGIEPNQPNTLSASTCQDGTGGNYHTDKSLDSFVVTNLSGSTFMPGDTVRVDYVTGGIFIGRCARIGPHITPFAGITQGLIKSSLRALGAENSFVDDRGYGVAVKGGVDWMIGPWSDMKVVVRTAVRYQFLSLGASIPNDLTYRLGVGVLFVLHD